MINVTSNPPLKLDLGVATSTTTFTTDATPAIQTTVTASANGNSLTLPSTAGFVAGDFVVTETGNSAGTGPWVTTIIGVTSATVLGVAQPGVRSAVTNAVLNRFERIETRYRAKKVTLTNLTNGDVYVWDTTLNDNQAKYTASGSGTTTTISDGILNRSNCIAIHPNLLPPSSSFSMTSDYEYREAAVANSTVTGVTVSPSTATGSTTFSAVVAGTNSPSQAVTWAATAGSISSTGVFTAPAATSSVQNITVTATSVADPSKSGTAAVTIAAATATSTVTSVIVSPTTATGSRTFTATVAGTNSPSQAVTWTASAGSITSGGVFTAPAATSAVQNITITARSAQDTTKAGTAAVTIAAADNSTAPPTFKRSLSRTINISEVPGKFDQDGSFWSLSNPKKPTGSIDPNATIDITFNWTALLADIQDSISDVQFDIVGLTNKGAFRDGAFATIFVGSAVVTSGVSPSITCRITTSSNPARVEDRTVFLTLEQQ